MSNTGTSQNHRSARPADPDGSATQFLVAANGIGTPRLLLASADARHRDGLANASGLVGRGLMLHPMTLVEGGNPAGPPWHGRNGGLINSLEFYRSDPSRGFLRGARWALTAAGLPLAAALGGRVGRLGTDTCVIAKIRK